MAATRITMVLPVRFSHQTRAVQTTTRELSEHARTNMWLIEQFLRVKFKVEERDGLWLVSV